MFIVFEGCDGTGKTTHSKKLFNALNPNKSSKLLVFPARNTPVGNLIDNYLNNKANSLGARVSHLLFSANRWEFDKLLRGKEYDFLISDRYYFSGIVYTKTLDPTIPTEWLKKIDEGLPEPDIVFYLYKDSEGDNLSIKNGEIYETEDFLREVKKNYEDLYLKEKNWIRINTSRPSKEVFKDIFDEVKNFL